MNILIRELKRKWLFTIVVFSRARMTEYTEHSCVSTIPDRIGYLQSHHGRADKMGFLETSKGISPTLLVWEINLKYIDEADRCHF